MKLKHLVFTIILTFLSLNLHSQEIESLFKGTINTNHSYLTSEGFSFAEIGKFDSDIIYMTYQLSENSDYLLYEIFYSLNKENPSTILMITSLKEVYSSWLESCQNMEIDEQFEPQIAYYNDKYRFVFDILLEENNGVTTESYSIQFILK